MAYAISIWNNTPDTWEHEVKSSTVLSLIKTEGKIKNVSDEGVLQELDLNEPLTKLDFETYGVSDLSIISETELDKLTDFEVVVWSDDDEVPKIELSVPPYNLLDGVEEPSLLIYTEEANPIVTTKSVPKPQLIKPNKDIRFNLLKEINTMSLTSNETLLGKVRMIFSVDSGATWRTFNRVTSNFDEINERDLQSISQRGMTEDVFNEVGALWNDIIKESKVRFAYYLEQDSIEDVANIDKLEINIDLDGRWKKAIHPTDYDYEFDNENIYVHFKTDGSYKVNYAE